MEFEVTGKFEITDYSKSGGYHLVKSITNGLEIAVDLYVDGTFDETNAPNEERSWYHSRESLIGKVIEIGSIIPILYAARNITIVNNQQRIK